MQVSDFPNVQKLSVAEKIQLAEALWNDISAHPESVPFPPSHRAELDRRMSTYNADPENHLTLEQLKSQIEKLK